MPTATESQIIFGLYDAFYLRAPDQEGYLYWKAQIGEGKQSLVGLSDSFYNQSYSQNNLGYGAMEDEAFVKAIYANVLAGTGVDEPAQSEVDYWVTYLENHSRGDFVVTFVTAAIQYDVGDDEVAAHRQDTLLNRIAVGESFLTTLGAATNVSPAAVADQSLLPSDPAFKAAQKIISGVTYVDSTATNASNYLVIAKDSGAPITAINNATPEQIFGTGSDMYTLTENTDIATATVFDAPLVYTPGGDDRINSLQDEDRLTATKVTVDGAEVYNPDSALNATLGNANDNGDVLITPELNGIATINVAFTGSGATAVTTLDVQDATGINAVNITRVTDPGTNAFVQNLVNVPAHLSAANIVSPAANLGFTFTDAAVKGATDETTLTLTDVTVGLLVVQENATLGALDQGVETINLVADGAADGAGIHQTNATTGVETAPGGFAAQDLTTLNISGDADLTIANFFNADGTLSKVDASALAGALDIDIASETGAQSGTNSGVNVAMNFIGGDGGNTVRVGRGLGSTDTITGGKGADTLRVYNNATANLVADKVTITSIETLDVRTNDQTATEGVGFDLNGNGVTNEVVGNEVTTPTTLTADTSLVGGLQNVVVRNDGRVGATGLVNFNLTKVSATLASTTTDGITLLHGTNGNNALANTQVSVNLADATGSSDTVALTILNDINTDRRSNFNLSATGKDSAVERVTLNDRDTESNTVNLLNVASHAGAGSTITLNGGSAGTFINLDATVRPLASDLDQPARSGGYRLDNTGGTADFVVDRPAGVLLDSSVTSPTMVTSGAVVASDSYRTLDNGAADDVRIVAENLVAGDNASDVIARFNDITRGNGSSSMAITTGAGNDTLIFDATMGSIVTAGYTSGDTVTTGAGWDTLVIDGKSAERITIGNSEWDNTTGIDALRFAGNQGIANKGNATFVKSFEGGYIATIDNEFVQQADAASRLTIINNDGELTTNSESDLVLNLYGLSQSSNVTFIGANGTGLAEISSNRLQLSNASANSNNILRGGDTQVADETWTAAQVKAGNAGNNNVLEVINDGQVTLSDLGQVSDFGRIEATTDITKSQTLELTLNDITVGRLVDSNHKASATPVAEVSQVERLVVVSNDNANPAIANAYAQLKIDASAVGNAYALDIMASRGTDSIVGTAGDDRVVMLGNYTTGQFAADTKYGVALEGRNTGINEFGVDGKTGTVATNADDAAARLLVLDTIDFKAGASNTLETYGALDLTKAAISAMAGSFWSLEAHSNVAISGAQYNDAALKTVAVVGAGPHILTISGATDPVDLSGITDDTSGDLYIYATDAAGKDVAYNTKTEIVTTDKGGRVIYNGVDIGPKPPVVTDADFTVQAGTFDGVEVGTVTAPDPDGTVVGFAITAGNTDVNKNGVDAFAISAAGVVTVQDTGDLIVADPANPFSLTVQATDNQGLTGTGVAMVTVTPSNLPPVVDPATFAVLSNAPDATEVGTVTAPDPDGTVVGFAITAGNTDVNKNGVDAFAISAAGVVTVQDTGDLSNAATPAAFALTVQATDDLGATGDAAVEVTVTPAGNFIELSDFNNTTVKAVAGVAETFILHFDSVNGTAWNASANPAQQAVVSIDGFIPGEDMLRFDDASAVPATPAQFLANPTLSVNPALNTTNVAFFAVDGSAVTLMGIQDVTLGGATPYFEVV